MGRGGRDLWPAWSSLVQERPWFSAKAQKMLSSQILIWLTWTLSPTQEVLDFLRLESPHSLLPHFKLIYFEMGVFKTIFVFAIVGMWSSEDNLWVLGLIRRLVGRPCYPGVHLSSPFQWGLVSQGWPWCLLWSAAVVPTGPYPSSTLICFHEHLKLWFMPFSFASRLKWFLWLH